MKSNDLYRFDGEYLSRPETLESVDDNGYVVLPAEGDFFRAEYEHLGTDLLIRTPSGSSFLVPDYFMSETPPDFLTSTGGVVSSAIVARLAGPQTPGMIAQATTIPVLGEPIGSITELEGAVKVTRVDGTEVSLTSGGDIYQGDVLETGAKASVGIVFADDTTFSLGEEGRMTMDEMVYDPDTQSGTFGATVLTGTFSFVSGQIAKTSPDAMTLATPIATIGIRGSTGLGRASGEGAENTITLVPDIDGNLGELVISTQAGTLVLNLANASTTLTSAFAPPGTAVIMTPQQIQQQFGATFTVLTKVVAKQAQAKAAQADQDAQAAKGDADKAQADADAAEAEAAQAEEDAAQAEAEAQAAQVEADAAQAEVEAAKASGDEEALAAAQAKAADAEAKAQAAEAKVADAKIEAEQAAEAAAAAVSQAAAAKATATDAEAAAAQAQQFSSMANTASATQAGVFATTTEVAEETSPPSTASTATTVGTITTIVSEDETPTGEVDLEIVLSEGFVLTFAAPVVTVPVVEDTTDTPTPDDNSNTPNTYDYSAIGSAITVILTGTSGTVTGGASATLSNVGSLTGTSFSDTYTLSGVTLDTLKVGTGSDAIVVDATTRITNLSNDIRESNTLQTTGLDGTAGDMDLRGTTLSGNFDITLNTTQNSSSSTVLKVDSSTLFTSGNTITFSASDNVTHIESDNGLNLSGVSVSNASGIYLDTGNDTVGATLTITATTSLSTAAITGSGDDKIVLGDSGTYTFHVNAVTGISNITFNGTGTNSLAVNQADLTTVTTITGNTGSDTITTADTSLNLSAITMTNIDSVTTSNATGTTFTGTSGNDTIIGIGGADDIAGGGGADTLTGGVGANIFRYASTSDSAVGSGDTITDFNAVSTDTINLQALTLATWNGVIASFSTATATFSNTSAMQVAFNDTSKLLQIDTDGNGTADMDITLTNVSSSALDTTDFAGFSGNA